MVVETLDVKLFPVRLSFSHPAEEADTITFAWPLPEAEAVRTMTLVNVVGVPADVE
jgi:hypothetical protein